MRKTLIFIAIAVLVGLLMQQIVVSRKRVTIAQRKAGMQPPAPFVSSRLKMLEQAVGIKKKRLRRDEKNLYLDVTVHIKERCSPGDADLLRLELNGSDEPQLLVSVEPLDGSENPKPLVNVVGMELVTSGASFTFPISRRAREKRLGLFICKDSTQTGHCQGKPYVDLNRIFQEHSRAKGTLRNTPDRIYFFQFLNLADGENVAVLDHVRLSRENAARLPEYLHETDPGVDLGAIAADATKIADVTKAALSLPMGFGTGLRVDLPMQNQRICRNLPRMTRR